MQVTTALCRQRQRGGAIACSCKACTTCNHAHRLSIMHQATMSVRQPARKPRLSRRDRKLAQRAPAPILLLDDELLTCILELAIGDKPKQVG